MIGDFNLPDVDWMEGSSSAKQRSLIETDEALLEQIVDFPAHIKGNCCRSNPDKYA
jgi:hypothetical protein